MTNNDTGAPTNTEAEAKIQADTDSLAAEIHEALEFQYDQCDHGTYHGGHLHGEPYQMCRISAERIVRRRAAARQESAKQAAHNYMTRNIGPSVGTVADRIKTAFLAGAHWATTNQTRKETK